MMAEDTEKLLAMCREWAEREGEVTPIEALTLLTEFYMEQCGVSVTLRTLAYEASEYWMYQLSLTDHPLGEICEKNSFTQLMPYLSEEFAARKNHYWDYDIACLDEDSMIAGATDIMMDEWNDDKFRIAFACGFLHSYDEYQKFMRTYRAWHEHTNNKANEIMKAYKSRVDRLRFQLVENWCLCKWCQAFKPECENFSRWLMDLKDCIESLKSQALNIDINKKRSLTEMLVRDYDYNDANMIERIVRGRFKREKIIDNEQKVRVCVEFSENIGGLIDVLSMDTIDTDAYLQNTFKI